jgi:hypothetical protein
MPESVTASAAASRQDFLERPLSRLLSQPSRLVSAAASRAHSAPARRMRKSPVRKYTLACAQQQFKNETGTSAICADMIEFAAWYQSAPRQVFAHNATGSKFVGGPIGATAPAVKTPEPTMAQTWAPSDGQKRN